MYKVSESSSKKIWKFIFNKPWEQVIFLVGTNWDKHIQTVDLDVDWKKNSLCFKLTGKEPGGKAVAQQGVYNETPLAADGITVYYDATLSKLSYAGTENVKNKGEGIPHSENDSIYIYATDGTTPYPYIAIMQKVPEENYKDVYKVTLPKGYTKIRFAAYLVSDTNVAANGDATDLVDIPEKMTKPCYYGDSSDDIIYQGTQRNRGGYWGEAYTVRDAETGKGNKIVDVPDGKEKRDADNLYVNTTIYDYYSDYELNGNNRDNYPKQDNVTNHRIYQPFRQFNMALSDYYYANAVASPLYWGNFQNFDGSKFKDIAGTMNRLLVRGIRTEYTQDVSDEAAGQAEEGPDGGGWKAMYEKAIIEGILFAVILVVLINVIVRKFGKKNKSEVAIYDEKEKKEKKPCKKAGKRRRRKSKRTEC